MDRSKTRLPVKWWWNTSPTRSTTVSWESQSDFNGSTDKWRLLSLTDRSQNGRSMSRNRSSRCSTWTSPHKRLSVPLRDKDRTLCSRLTPNNWLSTRCMKMVWTVSVKLSTRKPKVRKNFKPLELKTNKCCEWPRPETTTTVSHSQASRTATSISVVPQWCAKRANHTHWSMDTIQWPASKRTGNLVAAKRVARLNHQWTRSTTSNTTSPTRKKDTQLLNPLTERERLCTKPVARNCRLFRTRNLPWNRCRTLLELDKLNKWPMAS